MDPISNALTTIRNASMVKKEACHFPASKILMAISQILKKEGFIEDFKKENKAKDCPRINIKLSYKNGHPAITEIRRISHLGRRIYVGYQDIKIPKYGIGIISTPKGVMTLRKAKKEKVGGEIICEVK